MSPSLKLMLFLTWYLLHSHVFAAPQEDAVSALPAAEANLGGPQGDASSCGGCEVVADVAAVVWYSEIFQAVRATRVFDVAIGNNTRTTRTSTIVNEAQYTIEPNPDDGENDGPPLTVVNFDATLNVNGASLYSPTAYNVFTAYTIRSEFVSEGSCFTVTNAPSTLASAYSQPIAEASGVIYLNGEGQQDFIEHLGFTSCSGGGENVKQSVVVQVQNSTAEITRYQSAAVLAPASRTLGRTTNPTLTRTIGITTLTEIVTTISARVIPSPSPSPSPSPTSRYFPSARIPLIVIGSSTTITLNPTPLPLPFVQQPREQRSVTVAIVLPSSGPGGANYTTVTVVPFISSGNTRRKTGSSWMELLVAAAAVGLSCAMFLYL